MSGTIPITGQVIDPKKTPRLSLVYIDESKVSGRITFIVTKRSDGRFLGELNNYKDAKTFVSQLDYSVLM